MSWDLFFTEDGRAYWHNSSTSESLWAKSNSQSQSNFSSSANYNGSIDKNNTNSFNRIHVKENNETPSIVRNDLRRPLDDIDSVQHTEGFQSYLGNLSGRLLAKRRQETKVNDARKVYVEIPVEDDDASDITTDSDAARFIEFLDSENGEYAFEKEVEKVEKQLLRKSKGTELSWNIGLSFKESFISKVLPNSSIYAPNDIDRDKPYESEGLIKRRDSTSILVDDDDLDLSIEGGSGSLTTLSSDDSDVLQAYEADRKVSRVTILFSTSMRIVWTVCVYLAHLLYGCWKLLQRVLLSLLQYIRYLCGPCLIWTKKDKDAVSFDDITSLSVKRSHL